jgi:hypothetical protein
MPWTYQQSSGVISGFGEVLYRDGYSGKGAAKNKAHMERVSFSGPIPKGSYVIGPPHFSPNVGPYTLDLTPTRHTNTYGRTDFKIHGDKKGDPGNGSEGCIVLPLRIRQQIWASGDHMLEVVQ